MLSSSPQLIDKIASLLEEARSSIVSQVNHTMIKTYRHIGREIVEHEQGGDQRAKYGEELITSLSQELTKRFGKGFSYRNLQQMKKLYHIFPILPTLSAQFKNLSRSHFVFLLGIKEEDKRMFYAIEASANNWSLRELRRQFDSSLYHRLALSKDKQSITDLAQQGQILDKPHDLLKNPYVLEFLGLEEKASYSEDELEEAIITNLQTFLLELGKGFMFVARQQRITIEESHYYIDLVFYNRFLDCFVLIDLKRGKLTHQDLGQMQMYVNMYDRTVRIKEKEKPTIGLVLCEKDDAVVVEYTLPEGNTQIFSREYMLYLPSKEELEKQLKKRLG